MQPTINTPFERFAFTLAVFLTLLTVFLPFLLVGLFVLIPIPPKNAGGVAAVVNMGMIVNSVVPLCVPIFCIICAIKIERDHLKALAKAEVELSDIIVSDLKTLPSNWEAADTVFIVENVVIANDYLRVIRWLFRKLVGGESKSFSRLLARARREATLRVLRKAKQCGANVVWNIRYETSTIQPNFSKNTTNMITGIEVLAYATAFNVTTE